MYSILIFCIQSGFRFFTLRFQYIEYICTMIDKAQIIKTLRERKSDFISRYHLKAIGIFGSFNRDDFTEKSDIDILVEFDQPVGIEFIDLANELEEILKIKVDLVSRNAIKPKYMAEIQKDLIYV